MKRHHRTIRRMGVILCAALAATCFSAADAAAWQDSGDRSGGRVRAALRDVTISELPDRLRKALLENRAIEDYVKANDDVLFRVFNLGSTTGVKHVTLWKDSKEVGYAMLQRDVINIGSIGDVGFKREKSSGRLIFKRSDAKGVWRAFVYPPRAERDAADERADVSPRTAQKKPAEQAAAGRPANDMIRVVPRKIEADTSLQEEKPEIEPARKPARIVPPVTEASAKSLKPAAGDGAARLMRELAERRKRQDPVQEQSADSDREAAPDDELAKPIVIPATRIQPAPDSADSNDPAMAVPAKVSQSSPPPTANDWLPITGGRGLMWISIVFVLALTLRTSQWLSFRNLDGIVLAGTCVLLSMRSTEGAADGMRWWSYLLLSLAALYWLTRGVLLSRARSTPFHGGNVAGGGMLVMLLFALSVAITSVATAPISAASRDGIIGGHYMATTGKLPAGRTVGADARSPLLYMLHAAAVTVTPATIYTADGNSLSPDWESRDVWMRGNWWESADLSAARLVNGLLLIATVVPLILIGRRLHSTAMGLTMAVIFCIFPGTVECLSRPDVMLAAALISWAIAFATLERGAGFLSTLFMVLAGFAWPWAWLLVPVVAGYFLRRGWDGLGSVAGVVAGAAVFVMAMPWLTVPTIPRQDGAVAESGLTSPYRASMTDNTLKVDRIAGLTSKPVARFIERQKNKIWSFLVQDGCTLADGALATSHPGINAADIAYYQLAAEPDVLEVIQSDYQERTAKLPLPYLLKCSIRTALEAVWLPREPRSAPVASAWDVWAAAAGGPPDDWIMYRRAGKVGVGLIAVIVSFILLVGGGRRLHQLLGGILAVTSGAVLVGMVGPVTNLVLIMPAVLSLLAVNYSEAPRVAVSDQMPRPIRLGAEPRISVER